MELREGKNLFCLRGESGYMKEGLVLCHNAVVYFYLNHHKAVETLVRQTTCGRHQPSSYTLGII